jgi:hypothetical protein
MSGSFAYSRRISGIWISLLTTLSPCRRATASFTVSGHFALVLPGARQIGVEVAFDLVVQLDADDFAAAAFDFIADLVIKAVQFGIVEGFFRFLQSVVGDLVRTKEPAVGESPMAFLGERHGANRGKVRIHDGTLFHKPMTAQVCEVVLHSRGVAVVGELREITGGNEAKLADLGHGVQLGVAQLVGPVTIHIVRAAGSSEDQLDALLAR